MMPIFIVIRGNSASGKTALANKLQQYFGYNHCLLLHQDTIRREILHAGDDEGTPAVGMIEVLIKYGFNHCKVVILEGILRKDVYGEMILDASKQFAEANFRYYLNVSFEDTIKYNAWKAHPFSVETLKKWWRNEDYLNKSDIILNENSVDSLCHRIISDVSRYI